MKRCKKHEGVHIHGCPGCIAAEREEWQSRALAAEKEVADTIASLDWFIGECRRQLGDEAMKPVVQAALENPAYINPTHPAERERDEAKARAERLDHIRSLIGYTSDGCTLCIMADENCDGCPVAEEEENR